MIAPHILVVAKAPVPGRVKTRLGAEVGMVAAAELAAASLADTLAACASAYGPHRCCLALDGSFGDAVDGAVLAGLATGWRTFGQRGDALAARLVNAHADAARLTGAAIVQVGMDTPQLTPELLRAVATELDHADAVLGPAEDGGWWVLAVREPRHVAAIADVPMSTPTTGEDTRLSLAAAGIDVVTTTTLRDVDTAEDAEAVAGLAPDSRFARAWERLRTA